MTIASFLAKLILSMKARANKIDFKDADLIKTNDFKSDWKNLSELEVTVRT